MKERPHADISYSLLKALKKSPYNYKYAIDNPMTHSTPAMDLGAGVHAYILEPGRFYDECAVFDTEDRPEKDKTMASKANKAWKAEFGLGVNYGKVILDNKDFQDIQLMADAVSRNDLAMNLIDASEVFEKTYYFDKFKGTDLTCRITPDAYSKEFDNNSFIADIKTTACDVRGGRFKWEIINRGYDIQHGLYSWALDISNYYYIVIEKPYANSSDPYMSYTFRVPDEVLKRDIETVQKMVEQLDKLKRSGDFSEENTNDLDRLMYPELFTPDIPLTV